MPFLSNTKTIINLVALILIPAYCVFGQKLNQATEQWSEPKKIFPDRLSANSYGSIADYPTDKLFYLDSTLAAARWTDGEWNGPDFIDIENTTYLAKHPSISRSGNLLYYIDWKNSGIGQWDLYVSRYDSTTGQWGPGQMLPSPVNSPGSEWCAYAPNDTTLLFGRGTVISSLLISYKTGPENTWTEPKSLDNHAITEGYDMMGITATRDLQKIYVGRYIRIEDRREWDLLVSSWDSTQQKYSTPKRLNINVVRDSIEQDPNDTKDYFPSISLDGRFMVFTSTRDTNKYGHHVHHMYSTQLLVDQNGDSVNTDLATQALSNQPKQPIQLLGNYPNPFNHQTNIRFKLKRVQQINIRIYNIQGEIVRSYGPTRYGRGYHVIPIRMKHLSSGFYMYQLHSRTTSRVGTFTLIK